MVEAKSRAEVDFIGFSGLEWRAWPYRPGTLSGMQGIDATGH